MKQPLDFLGLNIYKADTWRQGADGKPAQVPGAPRISRARASTGSPSRRHALYWGPRFFHERYQLPVSITENGLSTRDQVVPGRQGPRPPAHRLHAPRAAGAEPRASEKVCR